MDDDATVDEHLTDFANQGTVNLRVVTDDSFDVSSSASTVITALRDDSNKATESPTWTEVAAGIWEASITLSADKNDSYCYLEIELKDTASAIKVKIGSFLVVGAPVGTANTRTWYRDTARTLPSDPELFARGATCPVAFEGPGTWNADQPVSLTIRWSEYDNQAQVTPDGATMVQEAGERFYYNVEVPSSGIGTRECVWLNMKASAQTGAMKMVKVPDNAFLVDKVWIGDTSASWNTASNWLPGGVPGSADVVAIPSSVYCGSAPELDVTTTVAELIIKSGGTLKGSATGTATLTVTGDMFIHGTLDFSADDESVVVGGTTNVRGTLNLGSGTLDCDGTYDAAGGNTLISGAGLLRLSSTVANLGTLTAGTGTVEYDGANVNQTVLTTGLTYNNLTIDTTGTAVATQDSAALDVNGNFLISTADAEFTAAGNMTVGGNFTNNGIFDHGGYIVTMDGSADQVIGGNAMTIFSTLTIANTGDISSVEVALNDDIVGTDAKVTTLNVNDGKFSLASESELDLSGVLTVQTAPDSTLEMLGDSSLVIKNASALESRIENVGTLRMIGSNNARPSLLIDNANTTFTVSGTLETSYSDVKPRITKTVAGAGTFTFRIYGTLKVNGLEFSYGAFNGLEIGDGVTSASSTQFENVRFENAVSGGRHLTVSDPGPLTINAPDCYFDATFGASPPGYNVCVEDTDAVDDVVIVLEDRDDTQNGPGRGEAMDNDVSGGVAEWVKANTDLGGPVKGIAASAYDLNTGGSFGVYATVRDANDTTDDRVYILNADGEPDPAYATAYVEVAQSDGDIVGAVWWDTESTTNVLYFGTTAGKVFRVINDTVAKTLTVDWIFTHASLSEVTSPVVSDGSNVYFGGLDGATPRIYATAIAGASLAWNTTDLGSTARGRPELVDSSINPMAPPGTALYAASEWDGTDSHVYRINNSTGAIDKNLTFSKDHDFLAEIDVQTERLVVGDLGGEMHRIELMASAPFLQDDPSWPYKPSVHPDPDVDPGAGGTGAGAILGGAWRDTYGGYSPATANTNGLRIYYGDADGHLFCIASAWPPLGGGEPLDVDPDGSGPVPSYPLLLESGVALSAFPQYWEGVVYIANENGKVFVVDESQRTVIKTYYFGSGIKLGDIGWDENAFHYTVGGDNGRIYYFSETGDPTP